MRARNLMMMLAVVFATSGLVYAGSGNSADHKDHKHDHKHDHDKMSTTAKVGQPAPLFSLTAHDGKTVDLAEIVMPDKADKGKIVVLEWFNPDCPFVVRHHEKKNTMSQLQAKYGDKGVVWLAINSSHYADTDYNKKWAKKWKLTYPVLNDQNGAVGRIYQAKTTPHMYIIHSDGTLVYNGAIDNDPRGKKSDDDRVNYVDKALSQLLEDQTVSVQQTKPYGCSVKYGKAKQADASSEGGCEGGCDKDKGDKVASTGCEGGGCDGDKDKGDKVAGTGCEGGGCDGDKDKGDKVAGTGCEGGGCDGDEDGTKVSCGGDKGDSDEDGTKVSCGGDKGDDDDTETA